MFSRCLNFAVGPAASPRIASALVFAGALLASPAARAGVLSHWSGARPQFVTADASSVVRHTENDSNAANSAPVVTLPDESKPESGRVLRVAADPNNLPFSNSKLEGFENRIIALVAQELGAKVEYTWLPERRGFFRRTLKEGDCDVVTGVPKGFERALTTEPYYQSSYVFLTRSDRHLELRSYDDPRLKELRIGVQMIGDDYSNTPPAHELSRRGIIDNIHGYTVYGDYATEAPLAQIVDAVARGEIDVAVVWGPLAGYFAKKYQGVLAYSPVDGSAGSETQPAKFDICMGVRRNEPALRDELNQVLARRRADIEAILADYGVPLADASR